MSDVDVEQDESIDADGEPWFVLKDICDVLFIRNSRKAADRLPRDGVSSTYIVDSIGRPRTTRTVSEACLYQMIRQSDQPKADRYRAYVSKRIAPSTLGRMKVVDIQRRHVNDFLSGLTDEGLGATTVCRVVAVVQGALRAAFEEEIADRNPATNLKLPTIIKKDFVPWTPAQVGLFLETAACHRLWALFQLAVFTGMRRGLCGLKWGDIDSDRGTIIVLSNRVVTDDGEVLEGDPKIRASKRTFELDDDSIGVLKAWKFERELERQKWGSVWVDTGHVFTYEDGRPLRPEYPSHLFQKLRMATDLPKITFHGLRHEAASLLISSGAPLKMVSEFIGHSSIAVTADIYGHLLGSASRDAVANAAALVSSESRLPAPCQHQGAKRTEIRVR